MSRPVTAFNARSRRSATTHSLFQNLRYCPLVILTMTSSIRQYTLQLTVVLLKYNITFKVSFLLKKGDTAM